MFIKNRLGPLFILTLFLAACSENSNQSVHFSNSGLIPEAYIPADVGIVVSYSSREEGQYSAIQILEQELGDRDRISETASSTLDSQFGGVGLDFQRDLKPAFGTQFRTVYATRPNAENAEAVDSFTVVTLADPTQMEEVFSTLVNAEQVSLKKLSEVDAYVSSDAKIYTTIYEDLLFVTSSPENLLSMVQMAEAESLWDSETYQKTLKELGNNYIFYGILYPSLYMDDLNLSGGFSVSNIPAVIEQQVLVVRAKEKGLQFEAFVKADREDAKENGISFDSVPKSAPYLFQEIPSDGLMAYFESYGLKQTFMQADALGDDTNTLKSLREIVRSYFGMDFDEDFLSFLDKGYAISLYQDEETVIPGLTLYVDISSNAEKAQEFVNKLDGQLSGLSVVLEQALPGAVTKDAVSWGSENFSRLKIDLASLAQSARSPLPVSLTSSTLQVIYGIKGDRLILSTANPWDSNAESISESALYQKLNQELLGVEEGLILLDAEGIARFAATLRALREQLYLQVSEEALKLEDFLEGFLGGIAKSQTEAYESHFSGFLMLAD